MRKTKLAILLGVFLFSLLCSAGAIAESVGPSILNLGNLRFQISLSLDDLQLGEVVIGDETYTTLHFPNAGHLGEEYAGKPDLPYLDLWTLLPPHTQVSGFHVISSSVSQIQIAHAPAPIQIPFNPESPQLPTLPDPLVYGSLTPWPSSPGIHAYDGAMRGYLIGKSHILPIRYTGATQTLEVLTQIVIEVELAPYDIATRGLIVERSPLRSRHSLRGYELAWLHRQVANRDELAGLYQTTQQMEGEDSDETPYGGFEPTHRPSDGGPPVACIIITDSTSVGGSDIGDLVSEFQRLADWKTEKGVPCVVRTVSWIQENYDGHDIAEQIREFVIDAYSLWGTDYLLLGGDIDVVPESFISPASGGGYPNDALYGFLDGSGSSDPYWDVWVGRLSARNENDADVIVDKLLAYERQPGIGGDTPDSDYYTQMLALTGAVNSTDIEHPDRRWQCGYWVSELICRSMAIPDGMSVDRLYGRMTNSYPTCNDSLKKFLYVPTGGQEYVDWLSDVAQDSLDAKSYGIIYHYEHSTSEFLGGPSQCALPNVPPHCNPCDMVRPSGVSLTTEFIDQLANGPEYSILWSSGSVVNGFDIDCISEHWLLNPSGGGVAFLGKPRPAPYGAGRVDSLFFENLFQYHIRDIGPSFALATQTYSSASARYWGLLGDPEMSIWTSSPDSMRIEIVPDTLDSLVPVRITITVDDVSTSAGVDSALVALKQGTEAYFYSLTDENGVVEFDFFPKSGATVTVTATADNYYPVQATLPFDPLAPDNTGGYVVYENHTATADADSANDNSLLEPGEVWELGVAVKNVGGEKATDVRGTLIPQGPLTFDLKVDDTYDSELIYLGRFGAHPPVFSADTLFTLPELLWHGINPNGCPAQFDTAWGYFVWRDTTIAGNDWRLVCRGEDGSGTDFTGTVTTIGDFSAAVDYNFEVTDTFSRPDSSTYSIDASATSTNLDSILFGAREIVWFTAEDDTVNYGDIASGGESSGNGNTYRFRLGPNLPDGHSTILAIDASYSTGSGGETPATSSSMFILPMNAPVLTQRKQERRDVRGAIVLTPSIRNSGSGYADSVVARLSGSPAAPGDTLTFIVDEIIVGEIPPDSTVTPLSGFRFSIGSDDSVCNVRLDLEITTFFPTGDTLAVTKDEIDIVRPYSPTIQALDPTPNGMMVKWNGAVGDSCYEYAIPAGYNVYCDSVLVLDELVPYSSLEAFVPRLDLETTYSFVVTAQDDSGNESAWPSANTVRQTSAQLASGWPKWIAGSTSGAMCPTVEDVDGDGRHEAFAASIDVYAWHVDDGSELVDGDSDPSTDGLFFATPDSLVPRGKTVYVAPFAIADLDSTPDGVNREIVGVAGTSGSAPADSSYLYVWDSTGSVVWRRSITSGEVRPYNSPAIADLDGDGSKEIVLLHGNDIWIWNHDGSSYGASYRFVSDLLPAGSYMYFQGTAALADVDPDTTGLEIVVGRPDSSITVLSSTVGSELWTWRATPSFVNPISEIAYGGEFRASSPVIGDINNDGSTDLEIVVAMANPNDDDQYQKYASDSLYVLDYGARTVLAEWSTDQWDYPYSSDQLILGRQGNYVSPPAIGNTDDDDELEILCSGAKYNEIGSYNLKSRAWVLDLVADTLSSVVAIVDSVPRVHYTSPLGTIQNTLGQPAIVDLGGSDDNADCLWITTFGGHFAADLAADGPMLGWPLKVDDPVPGAPSVGEFSNRGALDLVSLDGSGFMHVFRLAADSTGVEWGQFGGNPAHTFLYGSGGGKREAPVARVAKTSPALDLNVPNPFNPSTEIRYRISEQSDVTLKIYGVYGRLVRVLVEDVQEPGVYSARWDGRDADGRPLPSGVYFYQLKTGSVTTSRKMLLLR